MLFSQDIAKQIFEKDWNLLVYTLHTQISGGADGGLLPGLRTLDPPLGPPSTLAEIFH